MIELSYERYKYVKEKYPELAQYNIYAFIFRLIGEFEVIKNKGYSDLYDNSEYIDIIRCLYQDFEQIKSKVISLMNNDEKTKWNNLVIKLIK